MAEDPKKQISRLSGFITERRRELFEKVLNIRTRFITVVLEDIYQPHNASAVLRSCECFGIQDVHIIENKNEYKINPDVVMGASKWLSINRYNEGEFNTPKAISDLRKQGYRIVATTSRDASIDLDEFPVEGGKFALFFGTELTGLSDNMLENSDQFLRIPMHGFTGSFNISVSAAVILHHLTLKLHRSQVDWQLDENERDELMLDWLQKTIKHIRGKSPDRPSVR